MQDGEEIVEEQVDPTIAALTLCQRMARISVTPNHLSSCSDMRCGHCPSGALV